MKRLTLFMAIAMLVILSCKKNKPEPPKTIPLVTTATLSSTGNGNYTGGGSIVSDGGSVVTASGVVWSKTNATPTQTDSVVTATATTGAFTVNIGNIDFGQTYYFRAFASNSVGTGYGDVVTLTTSNDSVRFTYNGQSVTYGIITSPTTGRKWLDRNIGAKRQATAYNDHEAYGDLFQWGRPADGHQLINWTASDAGTPVNVSITELATSDIPGHSKFISPIWVDDATWKGDWRNDNNRNRWNINSQGPCPSGWHVPTMSEWNAEVLNTPESGSGTSISGGFKDRNSAYQLLKLTAAGNRQGPNDASGTTDLGRFSRGFYWGSTIVDVYGNGSLMEGSSVKLGAGYVEGSFQLIYTGMSVRCIRDL